MRLRAEGQTVRRSDSRTVGRSEHVAAWAGPVLLLALLGLALWPPSTEEPEVHRTFRHAPSPVERDSLAALAANGTVVRWSGTVEPVAMEIDADPIRSAVRLAVSAPAGAVIRAADELGPLDTAVVNAGGAAFALHGVMSPLAVSAAGEELRAVVRRSSAKTVAVFGPAGWEARFLMETLEATGAPVAARIRVGPQTYVTQGQPLPLDTVRHSVAVVLGAVDAATADQMRRFVRAGGGLVLASGATGWDDLSPGRFGRTVRPPAALSLPGTREQLVTRPIVRLLPEATALADGTDGADALVRTAARRVGAGRVVQLAEEDTWRLALASDAGRTEHGRVWLTAIATAAPREIARPAVDDNVAPRAALVAALGPAANGIAAGVAVDWERVIAVLLLVMLVGEWAARRLGGKA